MNQPETDQIQIMERVMEHRNALYGFILTSVPNAHLAEDIFQDVCVIICRKWHTHDPECSFRAWAFGIARNRILQHFDKEKRRPSLLMDPDLLDRIAASPTWDEDNLDEKEALRECITRLSGKVRRMIRLRYFEGLNVSVLAERLGWTARAVSVALSRARNFLRECVTSKLSLAAKT